MDGFDVLLLVLAIVICGTLFVLGFPFYKIIIYFVSIFFPIGGTIAIIFGVVRSIKS